MRPGAAGHFAPAVHHHPANETARTLVVARITQERAEEEDNVLLERIELVEQRLARTEQITFQFAIHLEHERRLRFVVRVIGGEKVGKQLAILVNRIDRLAEEAGLAAQPRTAARSDAR